MKRSLVMLFAPITVTSILVFILPSPDHESDSGENASKYKNGSEITQSSKALVAIQPEIPPKPEGILYTTGGRIFDTGAKTIRARLDDLTPKARKGDALAAYQAYEAEAVCARITLVQRIYDGQSDGEDKNIDRLYLNALKNACTGVSLAEVGERFRFLDQAISAGNKQAMLDYRLEGPNGVDPASADYKDPNVIAWKMNSNTYLERLAREGDPVAWTLLSLDYQFGVVTEQNFAQSIKYQAAISAIQNPQANPLNAPFMKTMANTLDQVTVEQSVAQGRSLAKQFSTQGNPP